MDRVGWTMGCVLCAALCGRAASAQEACDEVAKVGDRPVFATAAGVLVFEGGLMIDADGAPNAYHPEPGKGLDHLANAGRPGNWRGVVTDDGTPKGTPVVQGPGDPYPGFYVSATSLEDRTKPRTDPRRYVDSGSVPYIVLPPQLLAPKLKDGPRLGDFAIVTNLRTGKQVHAIVADVGPAAKLGEGSIALAAALGVQSSPRAGGSTYGIQYVVYPRSGQRAVLTASQIRDDGPAATGPRVGCGR